ncbi:MAG: rod shape-determining protein MreC [Actinomycetota bacterium]
MSDRPRRLRLLIVALTIVSVAVITVDYRAGDKSPFDGAGRIALSVLAPIQRGLVTVFRPLGGFLGGLTDVPSLRARVSRLERERAAGQAEREQLEDILRENESLRGLLALRDRFGFQTMAAQVIGIGPSNFERSVFIDKGSRDGVRKDMPVLAGEGLAGRVIAVSPSTSRVLLVISRQSAVAGRLASTGEIGVADGNGWGGLRFELLDPNAKVDVGDKIVTSGYDGGLYPSGLPIGAVVDAPPTGSNLTRLVSVQPFVDFSSLDYVLLVTGERPAGGGTK